MSGRNYLVTRTLSGVVIWNYKGTRTLSGPNYRCTRTLSGVAHRQDLILLNFNFALVENATVFKDLTIMKYRASYCPSPRPCSLKLFKIQDKIHFSTKRNNAYINHMRCCPETIFTHQYFLPPPRKNISQRWDCTYDDIGNAFFLVEWSYTQ